MDGANTNGYLDFDRQLSGTAGLLSYVGNKYFWTSDFIVHQRPRYYCSVKMSSCRTVGTEEMNGENLKGCWLPFGTSFIMQTGGEYAGVFPVWDWSRLPGVTAPHALGRVKDLRNHCDFAGGASDGQYGAAAFDFDAMSTRGLKAWFFFDNELVALGCDITSTQGQEVDTTIDQCLLKGTVLADGREVPFGAVKTLPVCCVLHNQVGYVFPVSTKADLAVEMQQGSWRAINSEESPSLIKENVFTLWLNHGTHPTNAEYAYIIVPGTDPKRLAAYSQNLPVRILANSKQLQAVLHSSLGLVEAVFRQPGELAVEPGFWVRVDKPCVLLVRENEASYEICAANPLARETTVTVEVQGRRGSSSPPDSVCRAAPTGGRVSPRL